MDRRRIEELAALAALDLSGSEIELLALELAAVAELWSVLPEIVGFEDIPDSGMAGARGQITVDWAAEVAFENAPQHSSGFFRVPGPRPEVER